jgi:hypothetical protein
VSLGKAAKIRKWLNSVALIAEKSTQISISIAPNVYASSTTPSIARNGLRIHHRSKQIHEQLVVEGIYNTTNSNPAGFTPK